MIQTERWQPSQRPLMWLGPVFVMFSHLGRKARTRYAPILRRKENFASVRIFYCSCRRKTEDLDITGIRRERTGN